MNPRQGRALKWGCPLPTDSFSTGALPNFSTIFSGSVVPECLPGRVYPLLILRCALTDFLSSSPLPVITSLLSPSLKADNGSSLHVSVPAWVEFLHRETRLGQLAFLVAVRPAAPTSSPPARPAPGAASSSSPSTSSTASKPSPAGVAPATAVAAAAAGSAGDDATAAANGSEASLDATSDSANGTTSPTKPVVAAGGSAAGGGAAEGGGDSFVSPSRVSKPPPPPRSPALPRPEAWTCVRTNRDLGGAVQTYRESVGARTATVGSWQPKPRPRVVRHMGMADQVGVCEREISCGNPSHLPFVSAWLDLVYSCVCLSRQARFCSEDIARWHAFHATILVRPKLVCTDQHTDLLTTCVR